MNRMLNTGGTLCALALAFSSTLHSAHAANEEPLPDAVSSTATAEPVLARKATDEAAAAQSAALEDQWHELMRQNPPTDKGCFRATYPNAWEKVNCRIGQPSVHPTHVKTSGDEPDNVGNGNDYVALATGLITSAVGGLEISGVKSEHSVGVAEYDDQGVLGPNEYSIQINTNDKMSTAACGGIKGCKVWQQFLYSTDYVSAGVAEVYMQYWLLNYGSCPSGWTQQPKSSNCYLNSFLSDAPDIPPTELAVDLSATVTPFGFDCVTLNYSSEVVSSCFPDIVLEISSVWNKAEFNVVGDGGGSRADFNNGASITPLLYIDDGSRTAPTCLPPGSGTTGESNNLNLGPCTTGVADGPGHTPYIRFTESR
jgi:hypothetical protein